MSCWSVIAVGSAYGKRSQSALSRARALSILGRMTRGNYCLIGAGAAGLGALQVLLDEGFSVDCFERGDRVGGHWHTDYECLHLITPRDSSGFEGFPMPAEYPLFPSRDQMRDYILGFAAHHGLGSHIRFNTAVTSARPLDATGLAGWEVTTSDGERRIYDGVIVANGHLWDPFVPEYPGTLRRARAAQRPLPQRGRPARRAGTRRRAPGTPAATSRSMPRRPAARPTCRSATGWSSSPRRCSAGRARSCRCSRGCRSALQERVTRALIDVALGRPERYGLPAPATRNLHRNRPVVNGQLLHFIHHGRVRVAPGIERFDGHDVHFTDGTIARVRHHRLRDRLQGDAPVPGPGAAASGPTASRCGWPG